MSGNSPSTVSQGGRSAWETIPVQGRPVPDPAEPCTKTRLKGVRRLISDRMRTSLGLTVQLTSQALAPAGQLQIFGGSAETAGRDRSGRRRLASFCSPPSSTDDLPEFDTLTSTAHSRVYHHCWNVPHFSDWCSPRLSTSRAQRRGSELCYYWKGSPR